MFSKSDTHTPKESENLTTRRGICQDVGRFGILPHFLLFDFPLPDHVLNPEVSNFGVACLSQTLPRRNTLGCGRIQTHSLLQMPNQVRK